VNAGEVFGKIYQTDFWNGGSGVGSAAETTVVYRAFLDRFLTRANITSVVDVGCGDWQLGRLVDWSGVNYVGIDVVDSVIEANADAYGSDAVRFAEFDVLDDLDALPVADALLIKDVLQHWPIADCKRFLSWATSRYDYVVATNDVSHVRSSRRMTNTDVPLGGWRCLDVEAKPFGYRAVYTEDYPVLETWVKRIAVLHNFKWLAP
jgi:SAM-dependent methyltransferase